LRDRIEEYQRELQKGEALHAEVEKFNALVAVKNELAILKTRADCIRLVASEKSTATTDLKRYIQSFEQQDKLPSRGPAAGSVRSDVRQSILGSKPPSEHFKKLITFAAFPLFIGRLYEAENKEELKQIEISMKDPKQALIELATKYKKALGDLQKALTGEKARVKGEKTKKRVLPQTSDDPAKRSKPSSTAYAWCSNENENAFAIQPYNSKEGLTQTNNLYKCHCPGQRSACRPGPVRSMFQLSDCYCPGQRRSWFITLSRSGRRWIWTLMDLGDMDTVSKFDTITPGNWTLMELDADHWTPKELDTNRSGLDLLVSSSIGVRVHWPPDPSVSSC